MTLWYCTFIDVYGHRCNIAKTLQISFVVRFISTIEVIYFCQHIYCITNLPLIRRKCVSEDHNNVYFEKWNRNMISSCSVIVFVGREVSIDKWSAINFAWELFACVLKRNIKYVLFSIAELWIIYCWYCIHQYECYNTIDKYQNSIYCPFHWNYIYIPR